MVSCSYGKYNLVFRKCKHSLFIINFNVECFDLELFLTLPKDKTKISNESPFIFTVLPELNLMSQEGTKVLIVENIMLLLTSRLRLFIPTD